MRRLDLVLPFVLIPLLGAGCMVPKKKYDALQAELDDTRAQMTEQLAARDGQITSLEDQLKAELESYGELDAEYQALQKKYEDETAALRAEQAELLKDRSRLRQSVDEIKSALDELANRKRQAEERVAAYQDMLSRFQKLIDAGRLKVKIVDGRMIVELATDILFASGKAELSKEGRESLAEVGAVLADIPDRAYQVEGHTDDVPIQTAQFPSNWELGSARAVTVVRTLIEAGVPAPRLSAASYSEHHPVADNATKEGKSANRRIEIVVVPDLSQLPGFEELEALSGG
ncbi:MAG: OmpA family protein [Alphaproteobacteria bacterium]|nr:OmpA family protein [Alphaproteobacteria bacterium]